MKTNVAKAWQTESERSAVARAAFLEAEKLQMVAQFSTSWELWKAVAEKWARAYTVEVLWFEALVQAVMIESTARIQNSMESDEGKEVK